MPSTPQWMNTEVLINPAWVNKDQDKSFELAYRGYTGLRKNIRTMYAGAFLKKKSDLDENQYQNIGVLFFADQPGKFTVKNRFRGLYNIRLKINPDWYLSLGSSFGVFNYVIKDNPSGVVGSAMAPDGDIGASISYKSYHLGLTVNQATNTTIKPLFANLQLKRHYIAAFQGSNELQYHMVLDWGGYYRFEKSNDKVAIEDDISLYALYKYELQNYIFQAGLNYQGRFGVDIVGGIDKKIDRNKYLRIGLSYNIKTQAQINSSGAFQLHLGLLYR